MLEMHFLNFFTIKCSTECCFLLKNKHNLRTLIILLVQDDHHIPFTELLILLYKHDNGLPPLPGC